VAEELRVCVSRMHEGYDTVGRDIGGKSSGFNESDLDIPTWV